MSCETCKSKLTTEDVERLEKDAKDRQKTRKVMIICATVYAVCTILMAGILGVLAAGVTIETTTEETTTETTQTVEGDSAIINNVDGEQYNDNAIKSGGDS